MPHSLDETLIRRRLARFLSGKSSLRSFYRWFTSATWEIEKQAPLHVQKLVFAIKLRLAEYSSGQWSKQELRKKLEPFVTSITVQLAVRGLTFELVEQSERHTNAINLFARVSHRLPAPAGVRSGSSARPVAASWS
jgi:hypothetical protein